MRDLLLDKLCEVAKADPDREVCGLVAILNGRAKVFPIKNVHPEPEHNFAMDHHQQNTVMEQHLPYIVGMFHSHNNGSYIPSTDDLASWPMFPEAQGWDYYIIVDGESVWNWAYVSGELRGKKLEE